jgi:molybdopterin synthase catalytic subunit
VPLESAPGPWSGITRAPIDPSEVLARVGSDEDGAVILFLGTVRNHADGRPVGALRYEAYDEMAAEVLERLVQEAAEKLGASRVAVVHRVGELDVGEVSVAIAVSSPHRDDAYRVSRWIIEEIKVRLPVWKREGYLDGEEEWVEGAPIREG